MTLTKEAREIKLKMWSDKRWKKVMLDGTAVNMLEEYIELSHQAGFEAGVRDSAEVALKYEKNYTSEITVSSLIAQEILKLKKV